MFHYNFFKILIYIFISSDDLDDFFSNIGRFDAFCLCGSCGGGVIKITMFCEELLFIHVCEVSCESYALFLLL